MINEKRLEESLKFLADTDEEDAKLSAGLEYLKDKQKRDKAIHIVNNNNDKSFSIKEQSYYALPHEYLRLLPQRTQLACRAKPQSGLARLWRRSLNTSPCCLCIRLPR